MADNQTNGIVEFQNVQSDSENDGQPITGGKSSLPDTSALPPGTSTIQYMFNILHTIGFT